MSTIDVIESAFSQNSSFVDTRESKVNARIVFISRRVFWSAINLARSVVQRESQ